MEHLTSIINTVITAGGFVLRRTSQRRGHLSRATRPSRLSHLSRDSLRTTELEAHGMRCGPNLIQYRRVVSLSRDACPDKARTSGSVVRCDWAS